MSEKRHDCGTKASYAVDKCRCVPCADAWSRYEKARKWLAYQGKSLTVPSLGFRRRVEALMCMGWSQAYLAERLDMVNQQAVSAKCFRHKRIKRALHERMCELYDELHMKSSDGPKANWLKMYAAGRGYAPPLAWDDIDDPNERPKGVLREAS